MARTAVRALLLMAAAVAPLVLPTFLLTALTEMVILGLFAMSLDLLVGYTGLDSFGHAAVYGFGAYSAALLLLNTGVSLPVAILGGGLAGNLLARQLTRMVPGLRIAIFEKSTESRSS